MRKEVLVAILVGAFLGLVVAFGIWRANKALVPQQKTEEASTPSPAREEAVAERLIIVEPEDNTVVSEGSIVLKGAAQPKALIVILYNTGEIIMEAEENGSFEQEIELEGGANEIKVIAYDGEGRREEKAITVVFSTEFSGS